MLWRQNAALDVRQLVAFEKLTLFYPKICEGFTLTIDILSCFC